MIKYDSELLSVPLSATKSVSVCSNISKFEISMLSMLSMFVDINVLTFVDLDGNFGAYQGTCHY